MAFPTTSVLDNFTRADVDPIAGNWSGPLWTGDSRFRLVSNTLRPKSTAGWSGSWWNPTTFASDQEAFITITTLPGAAQQVYIQMYLRVVNPGGSVVDGFYVRLDINSGTQALTIRKSDAGSESQVGAMGGSPGFVSGDQLGFSASGDTLTVYKNGSSIYQTTSAGKQRAGYLAVEMQCNVTSEGVLDDFGGGATVSGQIILPDADIAAGGWTTSPLFSKINDSSDATIITATAA